MSIIIVLGFDDIELVQRAMHFDSDLLCGAMMAVDQARDDPGVPSLMNDFLFDPDEGLDSYSPEEESGNFEITEKWFDPKPAILAIEGYLSAVEKGIIKSESDDVMGVLLGFLELLKDAEKAGKRFNILVDF